MPLRPVHQIRSVADDRGTVWVAEGSDPQFVIEGPFPRGLWELRFVAAALEQSPYARMQLYLTETGEFSEELSLRFDQMATRESVHRLRFFLPFRAAALRFDPMDAPGRFRLGPVVALRRSLVVGILRRVMTLATVSPRRFIHYTKLALRMAVDRDRRDWYRALAGLAAPARDDGYRRWMKQRLAVREDLYPVRPEEGLLSLVTTVYDTPPAFLSQAVQSVRAQRYGRFEWVILDNGSRDAGTRAVLREAASDARVRLHRVEANLGIIGGMSFVLERASGRYILPLDSDDYLYPDTLRIMAHYIQRHGYPALLYSDEDRIREDEHTEAFFKPGWDPTLLRNCCYIAHLCAIDRNQALALGAYTDPGAEGCHDWDTFLRFVRAGHIAVHVPEIIYSWRMHPASTAANVHTKQYVFDSHRHVLSRHLAALGLSDRLTVELSPLFPATPDWWVRRRRVVPRPLDICVFVDDAPAAEASVRRILATVSGYPVTNVTLAGSSPRTDLEALTKLAAAVGPRPAEGAVRVADGAGITALVEVVERCVHGALSPALMVLLSAAVVPENDEWPWEALGLMESFPNALVIGGRLMDTHRRVVSAGECFGFDGLCGSPDSGRAEHDPGYFGLALKQREASAVSGAFCVVDPHFLARIGPGLARSLLDLSLLGAWLGAAALKEGARVIYSPFIVGTVTGVLWPEPSGDGGMQAFASAHGDVIPDRRYYHPLLSLDPGRAFTPLSSADQGSRRSRVRVQAGA